MFNVGVAGPQGKDSARMRRRHWVCRELGEEVSPIHRGPWAQSLLLQTNPSGPESRPPPPTLPWGPGVPLAEPWG